MAASADAPNDDDAPDWAHMFDGHPGQLWTLPDSVEIHGPGFDPEHWRRLIDAANNALADVATQAALAMASSLLLGDTAPWPTETAWKTAATLAHMVHPWTIAADTGHPTEADYYREDRPCVISSAP